MSKQIKFSLDGKEVPANEDETIWQVAKRVGTTIPHLCHKDATGYRSDGNCRACMVEIDGERVPADVKYLGHRYGDDYQHAALHYALVAGDHSVELLEYPDLTDRQDQLYFIRRFVLLSAGDGAQAGFTLDNGDSHLASGTLAFALQNATAIEEYTGTGRGRDAGASELERGLAVIQNSDCLGCHSDNHRITGPAWSEVAKRFRGNLQEPVIAALAASILKGQVGNWGKVPMPGHPGMSEADARDAVAYILSVEEADCAECVPPPRTHPRPPGEATWLVPIEGHHSCGTAPESHRTSLFAWLPGLATRTTEDTGVPPFPPLQRHTATLPTMKRLLVAVAVAAGIAAFLKRPVKQPTSEGDWHPAEHEPAPR